MPYWQTLALGTFLTWWAVEGAIGVVRRALTLYRWARRR